MIEDELRAAFARHEDLAPSVEVLRSRIAAAVRRRRATRAAIGSTAAALSVALVVVVPSWYGGRGVSGEPTVRSTGPVPISTKSTAPARNILLIGSDERESVQGARADAVMLLHLARGGQRAYLLSLSRDSLVDVKCGATSPAPLTCVFDTSGSVGVADAVSRLVGVRLDGVVTVRFAGLVRLVDALGGVDLNVDVETRFFDDVYPPGPHHFTGSEALEFLRARRELRDGDLGRIRHHQQFLAAVLSRAVDVGVTRDPARLTALLTAAGNAIEVDLRGANLTTLLGDYQPGQTMALTGVQPPGADVDPEHAATGPVAETLYGAVRADRLESFLRAHPDLVWPLGP